MTTTVEFLCKVQFKRSLKDLSEDDRAFLQAQRIINPDYSEEEEPSDVKLKRILIDLEMVADALEINDGYVQLVMKHGIIYVVKVDYEDYKDVYQQLTKRLIVSIKDVND